MSSRNLAHVHRQGNFTPSPLTELVNNHIYDGRENDIVFMGQYTTHFICSFNMEYYPFDIQICNMTFMLAVQQNKTYPYQ